MSVIHSFTLFILALAINVYGLPVIENSPMLPPNPEETGGKFEGDILLHPTTRGVAVRDVNVRWPNGSVPYIFGSGHTVAQQNDIIFAMRLLETLTTVNHVKCVEFRDKVASDGANFLTINNGVGCYAPVGRWPGDTGIREVSLEYPGCFFNGTIMHELMHTLGFYHEQSRPDRDSYVRINFANIDANQTDNFQKHNDSEVNTLNTPYDYGSVMHYGSTAFSKNGLPTIEPINPPNATIGQRITLSPIDIEEVQIYYGCIAPSITSGTTATTSSRTTSTTTAASMFNTILSMTLTTTSLKYRRIGGVSSNYYYVTKQVIVSVTGYYTFTSDSTFATYCFLHLNSFDPSNPSSNLVTQGHNSAGTGQLQFTVYLAIAATASKRSVKKRATTTYYLVSTSEDEGVTGRISITVSGSSTITITTPDNSTVTVTNDADDNNTGKLVGMIVGSVVGGLCLLICLCGLCVACFCSYFYCLKGVPFRSNETYVHNGLPDHTDIGNTIFHPGAFAGFYFKDGEWHGRENFTFSFHPEAGHIIHGRGADSRGSFVATGFYSPRNLRMAFDKLYQPGLVNVGLIPGEKMTIQVKWDPDTQSFDGKYYLRAGKHHEEQKYMIQIAKSRYR